MGMWVAAMAVMVIAVSVAGVAVHRRVGLCEGRVLWVTRPRPLRYTAGGSAGMM